MEIPRVAPSPELVRYRQLLAIHGDPVLAALRRFLAHLDDDASLKVACEHGQPWDAGVSERAAAFARAGVTLESLLDSLTWLEVERLCALLGFAALRADTRAELTSRAAHVLAEGDVPRAWLRERVGRWRSFEDARTLAINMRLGERKEWLALAERGLPRDLPRSPDRVYREIGWAGWKHFLGEGLPLEFRARPTSRRDQRLTRLLAVLEPAALAALARRLGVPSSADQRLEEAFLATDLSARALLEELTVTRLRGAALALGVTVVHSNRRFLVARVLRALRTRVSVPAATTLEVISGGASSPRPPAEAGCEALARKERAPGRAFFERRVASEPDEPGAPLTEVAREARETISQALREAELDHVAPSDETVTEAEAGHGFLFATHDDLQIVGLLATGRSAALDRALALADDATLAVVVTTDEPASCAVAAAGRRSSLAVVVPLTRGTVPLALRRALCTWSTRGRRRSGNTIVQRVRRALEGLARAGPARRRTVLEDPDVLLQRDVAAIRAERWADLEDELAAVERDTARPRGRLIRRPAGAAWDAYLVLRREIVERCAARTLRAARAASGPLDTSSSELMGELARGAFRAVDGWDPRHGCSLAGYVQLWFAAAFSRARRARNEARTGLVVSPFDLDRLGVDEARARYASDQAELVHRDLRAAALRRVETRLDGRSRELVALRFGLEDGVWHTLEELAQRFDVSRERVRQLQNEALGELGLDLKALGITLRHGRG